jgi:HECT-domain (ubiquitin-transferase)
MPPDALNGLLFYQQGIVHEDVISALVPVYSSIDDLGSFIYDSEYERQKQINLERQKRVLEIDGSDDQRKGILVDLLKAASQTFLEDFFWFSTGYTYVPRSDFQIKVEFNYCEMNPDSLPVAHTCDMLIKLPGQVYDANRQVLEQNLKLSFESMHLATFDMH